MTSSLLSYISLSHLLTKWMVFVVYIILPLVLCYWPLPTTLNQFHFGIRFVPSLVLPSSVLVILPLHQTFRPILPQNPAVRFTHPCIYPFSDLCLSSMYFILNPANTENLCTYRICTGYRDELPPLGVKGGMSYVNDAVKSNEFRSATCVS